MHINLKIRNTIFVLLVTIPGFINAQVSNTRSPYSFSGVGQLNYQGFASQVSMGGVGRALRDKGTFSFTNPASYSELEFTDLEFSAGFQSVNQSSELQNRKYSSGSFNYIALGLPIIEGKLGMALGMIPYSEVGYLLSENVVEDSRDVEFIYEGIGAINRIYLGFGYKLTKSLSLGINADMDFGNVRRSTDKKYTNSSDIFSFQDIDDISYRGVGFDAGVQYSVQNKSDIQSTFGATVSMGRKLGATTHRILRTYNPLGLYTIDTLEDRNYPEVNLDVPLGYGIAFQTGKSDRWGFGIEYNSQAWDGFEDLSGLSDFNNLTSYHAGGFFQILSPTVDRIAMGKFESFLKTLRFSAGVRYEKGYMQFNGQDIDEFGISFGLGIPMVKKYILSTGKLPVVSMVNLTAEWIQRGTTDNELVQEDVLRISVGLKFNDKWFIKRKFQ